DLRRSASGNPANIFVDTQTTEGPVPSTLWQNLAQGGEQASDMIAPVIPAVKSLNPKLIRIDHIFDYYNIDKGSGVYDFSALDKSVDSIIATGAVPMFSLSYTTSDMAKNNQNAGEPKNWDQWYALVKATAHHFSSDRSISGIYYEVWNEPDLFGSWHYGKSPNYMTLYSYTARAVADGASGTVYKIGGPAITSYYSNWVRALFKTCVDNHLRLDFISWHKYSRHISDYLADFDSLNSILTDYPQYFNIERLITETGPNSEPDIWYDNHLSGIHLMSLATQLAGKIHRIFTFEVVDGPSPRPPSIGWGIITNSASGYSPKPRYYAIQFLNQLTGSRLNSTGDGSWVSSLAAKNGNKITVLLVNYDPNNSHTETVPVTFQGIPAGRYSVSSKYYLGNTTKKSFETVNNTHRESVFLDPNSAVLVTLEPAP
ncbi:MAG TPA: hypothetical protein VF828_02285, partial [Patescibacteria group bacterium]